MKKKIEFKMEYLLYLFLILNPFFDTLSFIFRNNFPDIPLSPSTILRPIIPLILCLYIFIKDKNMRKYFIGGGVLYTGYMIIHLYGTSLVLNPLSYGTIINELQFVINYTYMIFLFFAIYWFSKNRDLKYFKHSLIIMLAGYLFLIYLSIITGTSSPTYIEGIGYKGWNTSGNGLGAILVLLYSLLLPDFIKLKNKWWVYLIGGSLIVFLLFLFGTRTGLYGVILVSLFYLFSSIFIYIYQKKRHLIKYIIFGFIIVLVIGIPFFLKYSSNLLERRKHLNDITNSIIDPLTNKPAHLTGDITNIIVDIKKGIIDPKVSKASKKSFLELYEKANKYNLASHDQRSQQFIYHTSYYLNQKNPILYLFGNGYQSHFRELTLEMEVPAMFYNFGIIGFIIYLGPFIVIMIYGLYFLFKKLKDINIFYLMSLCTCVLAFLLSFLTGYVYFYTPSMLIVVCANICLLKEVDKIK